MCCHKEVRMCLFGNLPLLLFPVDPTHPICFAATLRRLYLIFGDDPAWEFMSYRLHHVRRERSRVVVEKKKEKERDEPDSDREKKNHDAIIVHPDGEWILSSGTDSILVLVYTSKEILERGNRRRVMIVKWQISWQSGKKVEEMDDTTGIWNGVLDGTLMAFLLFPWPE